MSLQGTLKTLGIAEVLEFLASRSSSGRLDIEAESGGATYWMLRGEIAEVNYEFERESGVDAGEATYYALAEVEGTFLFDEEEVPDSTVETESVGDVLARTAAIADGWSDVEKTVPSPDHVLVRSNQLDGSVTIEPAWWNAIQAIGDGSTTRQLSANLELRSLDTTRMVADMARNGLIIVDEPASPEAVAEPIHKEITPEQHAPEEALSEVVSDTEMSEDSSFAPVDELAPVEAPAEHAVTPEPAPEDTGAEPVAETPQPIAEAAPILTTEPSPFETPAMDAPAPDYEAMTAEVEDSPVDTLASIAEALAAEGPLTLPEDSAQASPFETEVSPVPTADPAPSPFDSPVADPFAAAAATSPWDTAPPVDEPTPAEGWPQAPAEGGAPAIAWENATPETAPATDWADDEDDGWATDHSTSTLSAAPAASDPFGQVPAPSDTFTDVAPAPPAPVDSAAAQPVPEEPNQPEGDFGTDDRSSVLKFLRRD